MFDGFSKSSSRTFTDVVNTDLYAVAQFAVSGLRQNYTFHRFSTIGHIFLFL